MLTATRPSALLLVSFALAACSSTSSGDAPADGGTESGASGPQQACVDTATAVAQAAQRCGQDYQANYTAFINSVANGNCANIIKIRDEASLRGTCIPSFGTIPCTDLTSNPPKLDATCSGQLLRQ